MTRLPSKLYQRLISITRRIFQQLQPHSLSARLLIPSIGLVVAALLGSTLFFIYGTRQTQKGILDKEIAAEAQRAQNVLAQRANDVATTARILANDPDIITVINSPVLTTDTVLSTLNGRAVVVRQRFELDLIQIYNRQGEARTNLVVSSLYRQSSLLSQVTQDGATILSADGRLLLIQRTTIAKDQGFVLTGIDLQNELQRIMKEEFIPDDLGLRYGAFQISTMAGLPFDQAGEQGNLYLHHEPFELGGVPVELILGRDITAIQEVTRAGLNLMIVSMLATASLLVLAGVALTRSLARPIQTLARAASALADGDLSQQVHLTSLNDSFDIGHSDEIGDLGRAFNHMIIELRSLYQDLENKVILRTQQLTAASNVARAASASLDVQEVLQISVDQISQLFQFYHAGVFIIERGSQSATLRASSSAGGKVLVEHRHRLKVGSRSLVGLATTLHTPVIAQNVFENPNHYKNPFLPDTRSEAVFPLVVADTVIGALDVQSERANAFAPDIISILTTLADQLAITVRNAQLYEKQRSDAARLSEVESFKNQFLARMSNQLKQPLNEIINYNRTLARELQGGLSAQQMEDLAHIDQASQHLMGMINDILDINRIDSGDIELKLEPVGLSMLIESVMATAAALVNDKPINLLNTISPNLPTLIADKMRIRQVLINLLSYAIKTTASGFIILRAWPVDLLNPLTHEPESYVEISISDSSATALKEDIDHLFQPFSELETFSHDKQDIGLGLNLARNLVRLHGGRIWAESSPGQGCTVTFVLPVANKASVPQSSITTPYEETHHVA